MFCSWTSFVYHTWDRTKQPLHRQPSEPGRYEAIQGEALTDWGGIWGRWHKICTKQQQDTSVWTKIVAPWCWAWPSILSSNSLVDQPVRATGSYAGCVPRWWNSSYACFSSLIRSASFLLREADGSRLKGQPRAAVGLDSANMAILARAWSEKSFCGWAQ